MKVLQYHNAVLYANRMMKGHLLFCGMDMVHNLVAMGLHLSIANISKECYSHYNGNLVNLENIKLKHCKRCNEVKPVNAFRLVTEKRGLKRFSYYYCYCKLCQGIGCRLWAERNPERRKAAARKANRKYYDAIYANPVSRKNHLDACRRSKARSYNELSDVYMRQLIQKAKGWIKGNTVSNEMIAAKRASIQQRRNKVNHKPKQYHHVP